MTEITIVVVAVLTSIYIILYGIILNLQTNKVYSDGKQRTNTYLQSKGYKNITTKVIHETNFFKRRLSVIKIEVTFYDKNNIKHEGVCRYDSIQKQTTLLTDISEHSNQKSIFTDI